MTWLGVDIGGSQTRWAICTSDPAAPPMRSGTTTPANGTRLQDVLQVLSEIALNLKGDPLHGVAIGLTGISSGDPQAKSQIAQVLSLSVPQVTLMSDAELAWHSCYPSGRGHMMSVGTGLCGICHCPEAGLVQLGGRGALIDDAGSTGWIAQQALRAIWRDIDAYGAPRHSRILADAVFQRLGGDTWPHCRAQIYGDTYPSQRELLGDLARQVAFAADAGDPTALEVLHEAGQELAKFAARLAQRGGPAPIAVVGRGLALHNRIKDSLTQSSAGLELRFQSIDCARTAAEIARRADHVEG